MGSIGVKMRGMSGRLTTFLLTASVWLLLAGSSATAGEDSLTNAAAIVGSTLAKGDEPPPVDLEAIVTHRDATGTLFLRDDTGATFIVSDQKTPVVPPGERVRVAGVVHRGLFINGIRHARIERLGGGPRPPCGGRRRGRGPRCRHWRCPS
jgi:hypothetical protein